MFCACLRMYLLHGSHFWVVEVPSGCSIVFSSLSTYDMHTLIPARITCCLELHAVHLSLSTYDKHIPGTIHAYWYVLPGDLHSLFGVSQL